MPAEKTASFRPWQNLLALPNDSRRKTIVVTLLICLCCSIVVAAAAVSLKPVQQRNQEFDRQRNIVEVSGLLAAGTTDPQAISTALKQIEPVLIELASGQISQAHDANTFDIEAAAKDPTLTTALAAADDLARIRRLPRFMPVYFVKKNNAVDSVILPVYGAGLWSRLYGFLALEKDFNTARALKFYQHGETPGLGGEVDNPGWRARWQGKLVYDAQGRAAVELVKGGVDSAAPGAKHQIDALAGATLTSRGVENLLNFWLGPHGYAPFIERLKHENG